MRVPSRSRSVLSVVGFKILKVRWIRTTGVALGALLVVLVAGCGSRPSDLSAVKDEPLASRSLLDLSVSHEVESGGGAMDDAYVWRKFGPSPLAERKLLDAIRQVGLDSGWASSSCMRSGPVLLLRMSKGDPGLWANVQVSGSVASVKVGKHRPGTQSVPPEFENEDAFTCR